MSLNMDHLRAAEIIARILYDGDRKITFSDEEMIALRWAIKEMRKIAKQHNEIK